MCHTRSGQNKQKKIHPPLRVDTRDVNCSSFSSQIFLLVQCIIADKALSWLSLRDRSLMVMHKHIITSDGQRHSPVCQLRLPNHSFGCSISDRIRFYRILCIYDHCGVDIDVILIKLPSKSWPWARAIFNSLLVTNKTLNAPVTISLFK